MSETSELLDAIIPKINITGDVSTMKLPDIEQYNYWNLLSNRIICIDGEITEWDYNVVKTIIQINISDRGISREKRKPIVLLINSNGGLLDITESIVSTIAMSTTPVWTVNIQNALSGGCLIFLAGERRFTTSKSYCMCHAGSGGIQGNYSETKEQSKVWDDQIKKMGEYIIDRTNIDSKTYNKYKNKDWYINAEQQIEFGFATELLESIDQILGAE